jgi:hypothetical protein
MKTSNKILIGAYLVIFLSTIITMAFVRSGLSEKVPLDPIGLATTKDYNLPYLNTLDVSVGQVQILPGDPKVEITCAKNIREKLEVGFDKGKFYIHTKNNVKDQLVFDVIVYTHDLNQIYLYNEASIIKNGTPFHTDSLRIETFNKSKIQMNLEVDLLQVKATNESKVNLKGNTNFLKIETYNAGRIESEKLVAKEVEAYARNAGFINIHASEKLSVNISSAGQINYLGHPQIIKNSISSAGSLKSMNPIE